MAGFLVSVLVFVVTLKSMLEFGRCLLSGLYTDGNTVYDAFIDEVSASVDSIESTQSIFHSMISARYGS